VATRYMTSLLFHTSPNDPLTFAAVTLLLFAAALLAGYVPGRSALRVDPIVALRSE
jgi:ABC-type antimicrobial peptide transport system permease subunit